MSSPLGGATCLTPWCQGPGGVKTLSPAGHGVWKAVRLLFSVKSAGITPKHLSPFLHAVHSYVPAAAQRLCHTGSPLPTSAPPHLPPCCPHAPAAPRSPPQHSPCLLFSPPAPRPTLPPLLIASLFLSQCFQHLLAPSPLSRECWQWHWALLVQLRIPLCVLRT